MTAKDVLLRQATEVLKRAGLEDPRREARLLLGWVTGRDPAGLFSLTTVSEADATRFEGAVTRRAAREPLAFIVGETGFWTLDFHTTPDTLIPRGDSEALIEALLVVRPDRAAPLKMLDLGTGTGCLLLSALSEYPQAWGCGGGSLRRSGSTCSQECEPERIAGPQLFSGGKLGFRSGRKIRCGDFQPSLY
ncbi:release factor glutamine methyltransferase [Gluconobacter frateurii NBRC 103465]|nr:release factor glutamine methyltransferase [Gluconobacter frateurii NBRC 103465]